MIEILNTEKEKAILVAIKKYGQSRFAVEENLNELEMLTDTAGAETIIKIIQERDKPDSAYYIGKGKVLEIAEFAELNEIKLIIFDDDLTPTQVRNLERMLNCKILDRSALILDIFANHAKTNEAKTQVELAQTEYMMTRLTRAWTHLSKQYGGVGTKGPGETQIETDRRILRERIAILKTKLLKIDAQQKTKSRGREAFTRTAIVGYTNAGKSTLLNLLTKSNVLAENKLFATLDSTTRTVTFNENKKILMSDTVGFIRKLPHNLVASFRSTFSVVSDADILIHLVDISHPYFEEQIQVVRETLKEIKSDKIPEILVFNKVDQLEDKTKINFVKNEYPESVIISAVKGMNIEILLLKLKELSELKYIQKEVIIKENNTELLSFIHAVAEIIDSRIDEQNIRITYRARPENEAKILNLMNR